MQHIMKAPDQAAKGIRMAAQKGLAAMPAVCQLM
jgi:hypothetical protein